MSSPVTPSRQEDHERQYSGEGELWLNEKCLERYNRDVIDHLITCFNAKQTILDFGAGIGTMALLCRTHSITPDCLEINDRLRATTEKRGFRCFSALDEIPHRYNGIYSANVLEHIADDVGTLKSLGSIMQDGAFIALYLPAFMCLYSEFDRSLGHHRRYERKEIIAKLTAAGFHLVEFRFVDSLGFFAWLAAKYLGHKRKLQLGSEWSLRIYDRLLYPFSKLIDALGAKVLFGKNMIVIARKPLVSGQQ